MKVFFKENKIVLVLLALVLVVCLTVIAGRYNVEHNNKTYDIVLDYNELEAMAQQSDQDVSWWLEKFKEMGITKVGLTEESIITLMEDTELPATGTVMDIIMQDANWKDDYPQEFISKIEERGYDPFDVVVEMYGETADFVIEGMQKRMDPDRYIIYRNDDRAYAFIDGTADVALYSEKYKYQNSDNTGYAERIDVESSKIMYISLGFLPEKVQTIQALDMDIVPRTMSYNGWNDTKFAKAVMQGYQDNHIDPDYIIVGGQAVFGYDDGVDLAKEYIVKNGITIGLIENTTQLQNIMQYGVEDVAEASGYDAVRVFTVWNYIQNRYEYYGYPGAKEIENTLFRAVVERNVRVIYYKPIFEFKDLHTYVTDIEEYQTIFANLDERLEKHGFSRGTAKQMTDYEVNGLAKAIMGLGCVLGALLLLATLFSIGRRGKAILGIVGTLGVLGMSRVMPEWFELTVAFFSSVIFACIALSYFIYRAKIYSDAFEKNERLPKVIVASAVTLIVSVGIALLGGLMTAAPISSTNFMLEIDIFRGVKAAQLLPIAYFIPAYLAFFGYGRMKMKPGRLEFQDIRDLMNLSIKVGMILLAVVIAGAGVYYILRTGHDSSLEVSSLEMVARNTLEDVLIARPRTKEFVIAFPAVMLMVYSAIRKLKLWTIVFGLAGVIGMTSVCNTFQHIRTPLYLGVIRTGYSLLFGLIAGTVAILAFELLQKMYNKYFKKYTEPNV